MRQLATAPAPAGWRAPSGSRVQRPRRAAAQPSGAIDQLNPAERVQELVREGASHYSSGREGQELAVAVAELIADNPCQRPGRESLSAGQGTWEVFHAPHIARLSAALGARFQPIRYTLRGKELISNVRYHHPLLGTGWLSASGTIEAPDDSTLLLHFDRFWVDLGDEALRAELPSQGPSSSGAGGAGSGRTWLDAMVSALGRAAFLPQLARFPVEQLDAAAGLSVFRFPPLRSSIGIVRRSGGSGGSSSGGSSSGSHTAGR